jgi:hypothetical protein
MPTALTLTNLEEIGNLFAVRDHEAQRVEMGDDLFKVKVRQMNCPK